MLGKILQGRIGYFIGFAASFGLVAFALFIQTHDHLEPCPLCISQRIAFMVLGTLFLIAGLHNAGLVGRRIYGFLQFAAAATGAGIAMRHIWIQTHPEQVMAECGAGFDYIFEQFPFRRAVELIFKGTGECSAMDWTLLGFTIPQLSLAAFSALAVYAVVLALVKNK